MAMTLRMSAPGAVSVDGSVSVDNIDVGTVLQRQGGVYLPRSRPRFAQTVSHGAEPPLPESVTGPSPSGFSALVHSGFVRAGTIIACMIDNVAGSGHGTAGIHAVLSSDRSVSVMSDVSDNAGKLLIGGVFPRDGDYDVFLFADPAYSLSGFFVVHGLP